MITPQFEVTQDEEFIYVNIKITTIRFSSDAVEVQANENVLIFHLSPYYLRLRFDHNLIDDERSEAKFVPGEECIRVKIAKEVKGQIFEDLDLHSKLLARANDNTKLDAPKGPLIQEIGDNSGTISNTNNTNNTTNDIGKLGAQFNWEIEQNENKNDEHILNGVHYGFNNQYNTFMTVSISNGNDINELDDPEHTNANERVLERIKKENLKFDPEYYVSEYMISKYGEVEDLEINGIKELMKYTPPLVKQYLKWYKNTTDEIEKNKEMSMVFNETEQNQMTTHLPKKQYLIETDVVKSNYVTILSLLFAYNFEQIENEGTHNPESAWTIGRLTPQIAMLDQQLIADKEIMIQQVDTQSGEESVIRQAIIIGIRRSLSYPLHRNFELSMKAWKFVYYMLRAGKRMIIKALLDIHEVYRFHDVYYVYNKILLDDLCAWFISDGSDEILKGLTIEMKKHLDSITKETIEFDCVSDINLETGETTFENLTLSEMELLTESEYNNNNDGNNMQEAAL